LLAGGGTQRPHTGAGSQASGQRGKTPSGRVPFPRTGVVVSVQANASALNQITPVMAALRDAATRWPDDQAAWRGGGGGGGRRPALRFLPRRASMDSIRQLRDLADEVVLTGLVGPEARW